MKKYKIGYALSGGGAKGFAHAGAIKALEESGVFPDVISGTSAGSVVGAFYAAGIPPEKMKDEFSKKGVFDFMKFSIPKGGLFNSSGFISFLNESIPVKNIEDLNIPLYVVATDFDHGKSVVFTSGEISTRVMASSCVPIIFEPIVIDGVHYVDGGLFKNFPVSTIRDICDFVIGINVSPLMPEYVKDNMLFIAERSYRYIFKANAVEDKKLCDVIVEIEEVTKYKTFDLKSAQVIFDLGYQDMKETLQKIDIHSLIANSAK